MYIGIGACVLGVVFLLRAGLGTSVSVSQGSVTEVLTGATPIKIGTEIVEKTEEDETIFRIVTTDLGEKYNPIFASTVGEKLIAELLFEPLAQRNADGIYENVLAKEVHYDEETCVLTVTIKDDIAFANGMSLTSTHVRDSILFAILTSQSGAKYIVGASEFQKNPSTAPSGIKLIDGKTLSIEFMRYELQNLEILETLIQLIPSFTWEEEDFLAYAEEILSYGIGTGAFALDGRNDYQVRLVQNTHYRYPIETIEFVDIFDANAIDLRMELYDGAVDYINVASNSAAKDIILEDEKYNVYGKLQNQTIGVYINPDSPMGGNPTVRAILQTTIDRDALCEGTLSQTLLPVTSILKDTILPNKDAQSMMNFQLVNAHMMALYNEVNLHLQEQEVDTPIVLPELPQEIVQEEVVEVVEVEEVHEEVEEVSEEVIVEEVIVEEVVVAEEVVQEETQQSSQFSQNIELLPFLPEEEVNRDRVSISEDGELLITIMTIDGVDVYLETAKGLQEQLEAIGFVVTIKVVDQNEYVQAMYLTGEYDFAIGEMQEITEISHLEAMVELYGIDVKDDVYWLIEEIVSSEATESKVQAMGQLYNILENKFLFIPLGRVYNYTAVSTYWQDYVITPTTATPQKLYEVTKSAGSQGVS